MQAVYFASVMGNVGVDGRLTKPRPGLNILGVM